MHAKLPIGRRITGWVIQGLALGLIASTVSGAEKIQLSAPDKKGTITEPEQPVPKRRRSSNPFELLDRQNSTGGAIEVPGVAPSTPNGSADPRLQKRLREILERE